MRQLIGRGVVAVAVVVALAVPVQAMPSGEQPGFGWFFKSRERIVKIIKRTIKSFGDGLSDPKP
jgi:hypothetical protein